MCIRPKSFSAQEQNFINRSSLSFEERKKELEIALLRICGNFATNNSLVANFRYQGKITIFLLKF